MKCILIIDTIVQKSIYWNQIAYSKLISEDYNLQDDNNSNNY